MVVGKWSAHHDPLHVPSEVDLVAPVVRDLVVDRVSVAPGMDLVATEAIHDNMGLLSVVSLGFYIHDMLLGQLVVDKVYVAPGTDLVAPGTDLVAPEADLVAPEALPDNMGLLLSVVSLGFFIHDMLLGQLMIVLAISAASPDLLAFGLLLSQIPTLFLD